MNVEINGKQLSLFIIYLIYEKNIKSQILIKNIGCYRIHLGKFVLYLNSYFLSVFKPCKFSPAN